MKKAHWRKFEEAVAAFAQALEPNADVKFNHHVPDRDNGRPRQCDAWIETTYGGHIPFTIYVSCKDRSKSGRKIGGPEIDTFAAEIAARGASMGVLYTNTAYAAPAIEKAAAKGIPCCRLYQSEPADMPEVVFIKQYVCRPSVSLSIISKPAGVPFETWGDVFDYDPGEEIDDETILEVVSRQYLEKQQEAIDALEQEGPPAKPWKVKYDLQSSDWDGTFSFAVAGYWKAYEAVLEGVLVDGSYSFGNRSFRGSIEGPSIAMHEAHPGPLWKQVDIDEIASASNKIVMTVSCGSVEEDLRRNVSSTDLPAPSDPTT